jgi:ribosomal protein S18 acetylase RimI-like enzyme
MSLVILSSIMYASLTQENVIDKASENLTATIIGGARDPAADSSGQLVVQKLEKFKAINQLSANSLLSAKRQILRLLNQESTKKCIIDGVTESELEEFLADDIKTFYSKLSYFDGTETINSFVLAREGQKRMFNKTDLKVVSLEKIVVDPSERGKGLGKQLLHEIAAVALARKQDEVRLLIYKANEVALNFYFKIGFDYVDKTRDEPWDSWLIAVKVPVLFQKTARK